MEPLNQKLRTVIGGLTHSARTSKIISINAALLAEQLQQGRTHDIAALKVVATEIQRLSDEAAAGIAALHAILDEVRLLTQTINLAGRQRMLSQKIMKLFLLRRAGATAALAPDSQPLIDEFHASLGRLRQCPLNTPEILRQLDRTTEVWQAFVTALHGGDLTAAATLNERVLAEMHAAVLRYEELAGTRTTEAASAAVAASPVPAPRRVTVDSPHPVERSPVLV